MYLVSSAKILLKLHITIIYHNVFNFCAVKYQYIRSLHIILIFLQKLMNNVKSLRESIKHTCIAVTTGLKKDELIKLRHKLQVYSDDDKHHILGNKQVKDNANSELNASESPKIDDGMYYNVRINNKNIKLTPEQHSIVVAPKNSHYKVIACAGSGKTTTVLCRIKFLIDSGVKPYQIMLTTFNVDAAENMKIRMNELFGFKTNIYVGTIDALAYRFYNAYFKRNDFVGVSEYCTELLKFLKSNTEKSLKVKNRFEYVFFDEFQDCNDVQFDIIKEFAKTSRVTVIGDDAQNIYQWRGSNMDFILNFENYMNTIHTIKIELNVSKETKEKISTDSYVPTLLGCRIMTLKHNFRSTPEIINTANASIKNNIDQIPKEMIPVNKSYQRLPKVYVYTNEEEQAEYTLAYIIRYLKNLIPQEQIAVLSRNNYSIKYVEEAIEKYNITNQEPKINYVALISDDTRDTKPKIMKNHITLTTIHKSKGLEWDVVFLLSCNDDKFPSETSIVKIQEDRRLFYVGVTRAKRYLNFSFTSKTISRFIGELDSKLYSFDKTKDSFFKYKDNRNIKFKNGVTQLIELLEPKNIEKMRESGLLPPIIPYTRKVHSVHQYSNFIDMYYLQADYGTYIDRYISRQFGLVIPGSGGLIDSMANRVLHTISLAPSMQELYQQYNYNIQRKIDMYKDMNPVDIYTYLNKMPSDPNYIQIIHPAHKKQMICLIQLLVERAKIIDIYPSQLFVTPSNYMPYQYHDKFTNSYQNFRKNIDGKDIKKDIYNVSLCQNVYDGRRRLLYKDCFNEFDTDETLYTDINKWVSSFRYHKIFTKKCLIHKSLGICGELDMIDLTEDGEQIIDFKCSQHSEYKLEWIIQLMMYSALYKHNYKKIINRFSIYNPLKGTVTYIDIENWNLHDELLMFMDGIRTTRMNEK